MAKLDLLLKDELFRSWAGRTDGKGSWKLRDPKHEHRAWSTEKPCKRWNPWVICLSHPKDHWVMPHKIILLTGNPPRGSGGQKERRR